MPDDIEEQSAPHSETAVSSNTPEAPPEPQVEETSSVYTADQPTYNPTQAVAIVPQAAPPPPPPPPPKPPADDDEDEDPEERGMLRMSFMEHLDELRTRISGL